MCSLAREALADCLHPASSPPASAFYALLYFSLQPLLLHAILLLLLYDYLIIFFSPQI